VGDLNLDTNEIIKGLSTGGPFAIGFYLLGKVVLKAWAEDRAQLRRLQDQLLARVDHHEKGGNP
jgi:hypothetical protein